MALSNPGHWGDPASETSGKSSPKQELHPASSSPMQAEMNAKNQSPHYGILGYQSVCKTFLSSPDPRACGHPSTLLVIILLNDHRCKDENWPSSALCRP